MSIVPRTARSVAIIASRRRLGRRTARLVFDRLDDRVLLTAIGGTILGSREIADTPFPTRVVDFTLDTMAVAAADIQIASPSYTTVAPSGTPTASPLGSATPYGFTPGQVARAYGFDRAALPNGILGDGTGQTIVILDAYDNPNIVNDLHQFDLALGIADPPSFTIYKQIVNGQPPVANSAWALEIALDVQWAHAMAPGANIILAEASTATTTDLFNTARLMAAQDGVSVISMSFGADEYSGQTGSDGDTTFVTPAGHAGVTFIASSGDGGVISYPASSSRVLGIGGTSLSLDSGGNYSSETAWSGSGGGTSRYELKPSYQNTVVAGAYRQSPDVSLVADPNTAVAIYDSYNYGSSTPWIGIGGTSASAPQWASLIAIANQARAQVGLSSLDGYSQTLPMLYQLPAADFRDITSGQNQVGSAQAGYDLVTGLGTPKANLVIAGLAGYSPVTPTIPTLGNARFEDVQIGANGFAYNASGSPWTFVGNSGLASNNSVFTATPAPSGTQVAFLQNNGSFSQSAANWRDGSYTISFAAAQRAFGVNNQDFRVLVDGIAMATYKPGSTAYQVYTTPAFTVSAGTHTITFQGLNSAGGENTALIDSVVVAVAASSSTPSVGDAGFEDVSVGVGDYRYNATGSAWTFINSGLAANNSAFTGTYAAPAGTQVAFLQYNSSFSQSVAGWQAGNYTISFAAAQRAWGSSQQDFRVLVDGMAVGTFKPGSPSYQSLTTASFAVAAGTHTITFQGLNSVGGENTAFIDSVAIAVATTLPTTPSVGDAGFEDVSVGVGDYRYNAAGSAWTFVNSGLAANNSAFTGNYAAPAGTQVAFLQYNSSFSQSVAGWQAGRYTISFAAAQRAWGSSRQDFRVLVDGVAVGTFKPSSASYQTLVTASFAVTAGTHTITFQGLNSAGGENTAFIDSVAIAVATTLPTTPSVGDAGFEDVSVGVGDYRYNATGSAWTFVNSGLAANNSAFTGSYAAPAGTQVAFLQYNSSFSQSVAGWQAGNYTISFAAAQRAWGSSRQDFRVLVDGMAVGTFKPGSPSYQTLVTASFAVTTGTHTITFQGLNSVGGENTAFIDSVAIAVAAASSSPSISGQGSSAPLAIPAFLVPLDGLASASASATTSKVVRKEARPRVSAWSIR